MLNLVFVVEGIADGVGGDLRGRGPYMTQEASLDALEKITF